MRHRKHTFKIGRTGSHKKCLIANMLKSLIEHGKIETTLTKAKELKRHADNIITCLKKDTLASKRNIKSILMIRFNHLKSKEARKAKKGDFSCYNTDRKLDKYFEELKERFKDRNGGYTRIIKKDFRRGDGSPKCIIEFI